MFATAVSVAGLTLPSSAAEPVRDGASQATAAASCWEVKVTNPAAPDGVYWIQTPQLQTPVEIYCDQTTSGGGWELIGRGREDWTYNYNGKGTPQDVSSVITGTAAFAPKQLDSTIINGLMGGRRFDSFSDGVRIRRATNTSGTSWQEGQFKYRFRDRWTWALGAGIPVTSATLGTSSFSNTTTYEFGSDSAYLRLWTYENSKNGYTRGFNFGKDGTGSTSSTSYIYSKVSGGNYGTPFTQAFIRPKLLSNDLTYDAIPDGGTSAQTIKAAPRSGALPTTWGVSGRGAGGSTSENATEAQAFAQIGNTMYVGGNFTSVQKSAAATGADKVAQSYLAAFNATTGEFISAFRPVLNNQVKALAALPDGRLAVGGEFTTYGGVARSGLVVVDATTGALDPTWTTNVQNRISGGKVSVRGLDVGGGYLYATGAFTHFVHGTSTAYAKNGARIAVSTGVPDYNWNPEFNGTGTALDVSDDLARVYFSGYFTKAKSSTADRAAAVSTATGAPLAAVWQPTFSTTGSARYQQGIQQVGNKVWLGGSQHSMFAYDTTTFALVSKSITKAGGDLQAISAGNGMVFGGCHCENWNYFGTALYDSTSPGSTNISWTQADKIYYVGAWDADSGEYVPEFTPEMRANRGQGAWALKVATDGTLWAGGSMTSAVKENGANQWVGGFVRFAVRPHTAPSSPTNLHASLNGTSASVDWSPSSSSGVKYEVLRNDRVVATVSNTSATIPGTVSSDRFFVRAVDSWDNRSSSTSVATVSGAAANQTLLSDASTWSYYFDNATPVGTDWNQSTFDATAWRTGAAPLGWGSGPITTNIDIPAGQTRTLTSYFKRSFDLSSPNAFSTYTLTTRADDGIVVYVNGVEVGRANMPTGLVTAGTYALSAPNTATAIASPVVIAIPKALLVAGSNSVSVEVHSNYKSTQSSSMDLSIVASN